MPLKPFCCVAAGDQSDDVRDHAGDAGFHRVAQAHAHRAALGRRPGIERLERFQASSGRRPQRWAGVSREFDRVEIAVFDHPGLRGAEEFRQRS